MDDLDDLDTVFDRFRARGGAQAPCRSSSSSARVRGAAGPWRGSVSQLLAVLDQETVAGDRRRPDWPRGLSQFLGVLRRIALQPARVRHPDRVSARRAPGPAPDRGTARGAQPAGQGAQLAWQGAQLAREIHRLTYHHGGRRPTFILSARFLDRIPGCTGWIGNDRQRRVRSCSSCHPVFPSAFSAFNSSNAS